MSELLPHSLLVLLFCVVLGVYTFMVTRIRNPQVLIIRHYIPGTILPAPEYQIFGSRYDPSFFFLVAVLHSAAFIYSTKLVFGFDLPLAAAVALFFNAITVVFGFALSMSINVSRCIKVHQFAQEFYERNYADGLSSNSDLLIIADQNSIELSLEQSRLHRRGLKRCKLLDICNLYTS